VNETGLLSLSDAIGPSSSVSRLIHTDSTSAMNPSHNQKPNSLAKLLSFSNYYYGNESRETGAADASESGVSSLFDNNTGTSGLVGQSVSAKDSPVKKRHKKGTEITTDSVDNWVPEVAAPGVETITENNGVSRQLSKLPLLSQISVISNSAEDEYLYTRQNSEGMCLF
jgi:hypothetical protein